MKQERVSGVITHDEAEEAAKRYISAQHGGAGRPHRSIPSKPNDDDQLLLRYIDQQREFSKILPELENLKDAFLKFKDASG